MPLSRFFSAHAKTTFKNWFCWRSLNMASAVETSNAFCNNNAFIVYAAKLQSVEIQMFVWKGDHVGTLFTLQLTPETLATAAHLSQFWHLSHENNGPNSSLIKLHCCNGVTQEETLPGRKMVLPLLLERVEKDFVSFDTDINGLLISTSTREQLPAFSKPIHTK